MRKAITTLLLLAFITNGAIAGTPSTKNCCCPPCKQPTRTAVRSKLVRQTVTTPRAVAKHDTTVVYHDRTIHYKPAPEAQYKNKGCSACWLIGAALVGGGIAYLIAKSNDDDHVTNVTVVTPPDEDKKKKKHDD